MFQSTRKIFPVYLFIDLSFMAAVFFGTYLLKYKLLTGPFEEIQPPYAQEYGFIFALWMLFIIISFRGRNLYVTDRNLTIKQEMTNVTVSIFYTGLLIAAIIFFAQYKFVSREIFIESFLLLCVFLGGWRLIKRMIVRRLIAEGYHNINVLIVGVGRTSSLMLEEIRRHPYWGFRVVGFLDDEQKDPVEGVPVLGALKDFEAISRKHFIDEVIVNVPSQRIAIPDLLRQAKKMHLGLRIVPEDFEESFPKIQVSQLGVIPLLIYKEHRHHPTEFALKRLFDFVISLLALVILFPFFVIVAVLITLDSQGPFLYVQKRVGFKGRQFTFYKFRSMIKDAETQKKHLVEKNEIKGGVIFKIKDDPRVTRIGKFLRKYSIDELPQLFNVLRGDMSLVGPRPPLASEVARYGHADMARLSIRPGMTGLSQIGRFPNPLRKASMRRNGKSRSDLTFRHGVRWDLWYINNWSFWLDIQILWWTVPAVIRSRGAY